MYDTKKNAPAPTTAARAAFDRSVCFTFYGDYLATLEGIEQMSGTEAAYTAFKILAKYSLYGEQPDPACNPWGFAWPMVERKAKDNVMRRQQAIEGGDTELAQAIREYAAENPEATQKEIAEALSCHRNTVGYVLKKERAALSNLNHDSSLSHNHSHNHNLNHSSVLVHCASPSPSALSAAAPPKESPLTNAVQTTREGAEV